MATQRSIAAYLGIAQATVARALQGSPLVKPETRQRVEAAARHLGYRPNPMVTTLMEHIRSGKAPGGDHGSLAILIGQESETAMQRLGEPYMQQLEGYRDRAALRGYQTECFFLRQKGMTAELLDRMLYTRGIVGIILAAPPQLTKNHFPMKWERYALASISYEWSYLSVDRASTNHRNNVFVAFNELARRGYSRIGLALPHAAFNPHDSNWLAGYLACQYQMDCSRAIPVFKGELATNSLAEFRRWYERWKPDALLCLNGEEFEWMRQMGLSPLEDMAIACLKRQKDSKFSGIEENNFLVGQIACDIVVNHIIHNERGLSDQPRLVLVNGTWIDGSTVPDHKRNKGKKVFGHLAVGSKSRKRLRASNDDK